MARAHGSRRLLARASAREDTEADETEPQYVRDGWAGLEVTARTRNGIQALMKYGSAS